MTSLILMLCIHYFVLCTNSSTGATAPPTPSNTRHWTTCIFCSMATECQLRAELFTVQSPLCPPVLCCSSWFGSFLLFSSHSLSLLCYSYDGKCNLLLPPLLRCMITCNMKPSMKLCLNLFWNFKDLILYMFDPGSSDSVLCPGRWCSLQLLLFSPSFIYFMNHLCHKTATVILKISMFILRVFLKYICFCDCFYFPVVVSCNHDWISGSANYHLEDL